MIRTLLAFLGRCHHAVACLALIFLLSPAALKAQNGNIVPGTTERDSVMMRTTFYFSLGNGEWIERSDYPKSGWLVRWAGANPDARIVIRGWADASGRAVLNDTLSLRRARTVRNYLVRKGIAAERIAYAGAGVDTEAESPEKARRAEVQGIIRLALADAPEVRAETESVPVKQEAEKVEPPVPEKEITVEEIQQAEQPALTVTPETASSSGRYLAVKTNLAAWAGTIMNLAADVQVSEHFSVELPVLWCPWYVGSKHAVKTFTIQPEARYWLSRPGTGHFFGVHAHVGWFNVKWNRDRYQDTGRPLLGAGISYGYLLPFNEHWAGEFTLGAGYANMRYDTYYNIDNGARIDTRTKNYWGITRVGLSVVYRFNLKK
ncbi:DUF3575 domain-containing protein [Parabacteroides provencensis]|uniref:DUF3575 domain-containing protein n=1 Tax=Parabacteroides provencensis TaxID=1944636 RepID=UPI000C145918|nr:DUF3575 domain-containing protein [Parabacteroides provencensis]